MAEIDPRPYEALLGQAEADRARLHANAQLDVDRYTTRPSQRVKASTPKKRWSGDTGGHCLRPGAVVDNARVQLIPLVRATDATVLVVATPLKPIAVFFTVPGPLTVLANPNGTHCGPINDLVPFP